MCIRDSFFVHGGACALRVSSAAHRHDTSGRAPRGNPTCRGSKGSNPARSLLVPTPPVAAVSGRLSLHRLVVTVVAAPVADLTGLRERLSQARTDLLPRHLHETQRRDLRDLVARTVPPKALDETPQQELPVVGQHHVDEVNDDDAADVPQPQLPDDLLRSLKVVGGDGRLEVAAGAGELAGVDVDDGHRLGAVDDERPARREEHLPLERLGDLLVDAVLGEQVTVRLVVPLLDAVGEVRGDVVHVRGDRVVRVVGPAVAAHDEVGEVLGEQVTHDPYGQVGLAVQHLRRGALLDLLLDGFPLRLEPGDVADELLLAHTLGGGTDDHRGVLGDLVAEDASVIIRTAGGGRSEEELVRDIAGLEAQWESSDKEVKQGSAPQMLYGEPDLTGRIVRDLFTEDFTNLVVGSNGRADDAYDTVSAYVNHVAPHLADRVKQWDHEADGDLFTQHRIDEQIAKALERKVFLPSGGSLIIDRTEAMTVIDVNTGKFTGSGGNLEATVTANNLEAAEEIVRQLRLRDIGGIIVIDFIDMVLPNNRELLLRRLVECLGRDRTRHQVAEVTSLGLVQMTRKKIGTGLLEAFSENCEHCQGRGLIVQHEPVEPKKKSDDEPRRNRRSGRGRGRGDEDGAATDKSSTDKS